MNGREPYLSAAATLLHESGCTVTKWRTSTTGVADVKSSEWRIEVPEPRGPVSYVTFAHEVAHQMLHRSGSRQRWQQELEAWEWALATFERFGLPGLDMARADAEACLLYAASKALRRVKDPAKKDALAERISTEFPSWILDRLVAPYRDAAVAILAGRG